MSQFPIKAKFGSHTNPEVACSVAYVEFIDIDDVRKAINLTGTKLLGIPIVVQYTEAERNRQAGLVNSVQRPNVPDHIQM